MNTQPKPTGEQFVPDPDSFVPEADQRELAKPIGEWTGMTVANISAGCVHITPILRERIAEAHNAALSEAKAGGWISQQALDEYAKVEAEHRELRSQLATLVDALEWYAEGLEPSKAIAALAKVKEGK